MSTMIGSRRRRRAADPLKAGRSPEIVSLRAGIGERVSTAFDGVFGFADEQWYSFFRRAREGT